MAFLKRNRKAETFSEKFTILVHGKKIQCYKWGNSNKTVIVAHGWAGRATQFRRFVKPFLNAGYQVVGFDGPAHGKSEGKNTNLDEFKDLLQQLVNQFGNVHAIVAHSFGGAASLYALTQGLPVKSLVNIASPAVADEIINTFLRAMNGSKKTGEAFKEYLQRTTGKNYDQFAALSFIKKVPTSLNLLLVYDEDDKEVTLVHPQALLKEFPQATYIQTRGLGHTRILKNNDVIHNVVTFVQRHSSNS